MPDPDVITAAMEVPAPVNSTAVSMSQKTALVRNFHPDLESGAAAGWLWKQEAGMGWLRSPEQELTADGE